MMFLVINFFVTVLNEFIAFFKSDKAVAPKDHEVIDYMLTQLKEFVAIKSNKEKATKGKTIIVNSSNAVALTCICSVKYTIK